MKEFIFTMKKGTEVPAQFDGVTIPIQAPASNEEMLKLAGENAYVIFNRAYVLDVQKDVKAASQKEGATVDSLRKHAADYKIGEVRTRSGTGTGKPRVSQKAVSTVLGDDFLSTLTPEQRALYDAKMAALSAKPAAAPQTSTTEAPAAETQKQGNQKARR